MIDHQPYDPADWRERPPARPPGAHVTHVLKTWPTQFQAVLEGRKRHEIRRCDRDFVPGDTVILREVDPTTGRPTGRSARFQIGHLSPPGVFGVPANICVFTLVCQGRDDELEEEGWRTPATNGRRKVGVFDRLPVWIRHWLAR